MGEDDIRDNAYLAYEFLVSRSITTSTKSLVQEGQEDRDNNTSFNRFSKTDKEYYQLSPKSARILQSRWDFDVPGTAKTLTIITTLVLLNPDSVLNRNSVFSYCGRCALLVFEWWVGCTEGKLLSDQIDKGRAEFIRSSNFSARTTEFFTRVRIRRIKQISQC